MITYCKYKNFDNDKFQADIKTCGFDIDDINVFKETIFSVFHTYESIKKKHIWANKAPFWLKTCMKKLWSGQS